MTLTYFESSNHESIESTVNKELKKLRLGSFQIDLLLTFQKPTL